MNLPGRCAINKFGRINELVDRLNKLKLGGMTASFDTLYYSGFFGELDAVSLLEQVIGPEYQSKTSQRFQNRLKRVYLSGGSQSLDKCKDSAERVYLPLDIKAMLSLLDFYMDTTDMKPPPDAYPLLDGEDYEQEPEEDGPWDLSGSIFDCLLRYTDLLPSEEIEKIIGGMEGLVIKISRHTLLYMML